MKKSLWLPLLLLLFCTSVHAAPAFVQACNGSSATTTATCTFGSSVTAGDTIIAIVAVFPLTGSVSVTDAESNCGSAYNATGAAMTNSLVTQTVYCANVAGGTTNQMTGHCTTGTVCEIVATEVSGVATSSFDKTAQQVQAATNSPTSGNTSTTSVASEILIGTIQDASNTTPTAGTSYTIGTNQHLADGSCGCSLTMEYQVVSSTGAYAATFGLGTTIVAATNISTYEATGGGGAVVNQTPPPLIR